MKEIYKKLAKVQGLRVSKNAENPFFKCKYANLEVIMEVLDPILTDNNLLIYHISNNGAVETHLVDLESDGEIISSFKLPDLHDVQKLGAGVTYAKRYNLGQIFNIITHQDDDGDSTSKAVLPELTVEDIKKTVVPKIERERLNGVEHDAKDVVEKLQSKYKISSKGIEIIIQSINNK